MVRHAKLLMVFLAALLAAACGGGEDSGGSPAPTPTPTSSITPILNGPNAAGQTSYWNVPALNNNAFGGATRLAFFADGTGKLISVQNNCSIPVNSGQQFAGQAPVVTNFTWTATGSAALLFANAEYRCLFNTNPNNGNSLVSSSGALQSLSSITGGTSSASFSGSIVQGSSSARTITGTLVSGTL